MQDILIQEINRLPDDVVRELLAFLQQRTRLESNMPSSSESGRYANYWRQYIGAFAGEEWERPAQGTFEARDQ